MGVTGSFIVYIILSARFNLPADKIWGNAAKSLGINIVDISNMSGNA